MKKIAFFILCIVFVSMFIGCSLNMESPGKESIPQEKNVNSNPDEQTRSLINIFPTGIFDNLFKFINFCKANPTAEIEAKWETDEATYNQLVEYFADNVNRYGYTTNVRWKGVPKKFVDVYYDNSARDLKDARHSLRYRQRYVNSSNLPPNPSLEQLQNATWTTVDSRAVQYKSTPSILLPIWARTETEHEVSNNSQADDIVKGKNTSSPVYQKIIQDQPDFSFTTEEFIRVSDYRYRIELIKDGVAKYEISLDRVLTTQKFKIFAPPIIIQTLWLPLPPYVQCEVEALMPSKTLDDVVELARIAQEMQKQFNLTASETSKTGY